MLDNLACGIAATILVGGGMMTFQSICYFPGLCQDCKKVVQVDLLAKELRCPNCEGKEVIAYNDASLVQTRGPRVVVLSAFGASSSGHPCDAAQGEVGASIEAETGIDSHAPAGGAPTAWANDDAFADATEEAIFAKRAPD